MISISRLIYDGLWSEADPGNLHYLICRHPLYNCPPTEHVSTQGQGTALTPHSTNTCDRGQSRGILLISAMHDSVVKISVWKGLKLCLCFEVSSCGMTLGNGDLPNLLYYWYTCEFIVTLFTVTLTNTYAQLGIITLLVSNG